MGESRKIWDFITRTSKRASDEAEEVIGQAQEFERWQGLPYYEVHLDWLRKQSNIPIQANSSHMDMVVGATRSNTFREVLNHLEQLSRKTRIALGDD